MRLVRNGFTTIELLVVVGILVLLTAFLITYSRIGERQILLMREQAKLISALSRARALALQTFQEAPSNFRVCGYGVYFELEAGKYIIFRDIIDSASDCGKSDKKYLGPQENVEVFILDPKLNFSTLTLGEILYIPPDPQVILIPDQEEATIILSSDKSAATIKIHRSGQITTMPEAKTGL